MGYNGGREHRPSAGKTREKKVPISKSRPADSATGGRACECQTCILEVQFHRPRGGGRPMPTHPVKMTDRWLAGAIPPGDYKDTQEPALRLRVSPKGKKTFVCRYSQ